MEHWADRLVKILSDKGNAVCVGLDPRWDSLPAEFRSRGKEVTLDGVAAAYEAFCMQVLELVAPLVPVIKPQIAFFEACGPEGLKTLQAVIRRARQLGLFVILDGKRNDIASTAQAYADAAFAGFQVAGRVHPVWDADAITINPYLGRDSVEPFLNSARAVGRGLFVLVRTSNPGAGQFQDLVSDGKPFFIHVAEAVSAWTREHLGNSGFGDVGAVVGATHARELALLRGTLPEALILVPGYGAQGGSAEDSAAAFRADGLGAIVNSSRGILFPYAPGDTDWRSRILAATRAMISELATNTAMKHLANSAAKRGREQSTPEQVA
jgi:orotidine-5'-phosphate decarboxylase